MNVPLYHIDAFTDRPFSGNPAAVCLLSGPANEAWMQQVAAEMNLSETAFLRREADRFCLRWFTPTVEVDLCGHATLAAAHLLWEAGELAPEITARFQTRSGLLTAGCKGNWIELDFPAEPALPAPAPEGLVEALGVTPKYIGRNRFDYLVEVDSEGDRSKPGARLPSSGQGICTGGDGHQSLVLFPIRFCLPVFRPGRRHR